MLLHTSGYAWTIVSQVLRNLLQSAGRPNESHRFDHWIYPHIRQISNASLLIFLRAAPQLSRRNLMRAMF